MKSNLETCDCIAIHQDAVDYVIKRMPSIKHIQQLTTMFKVLSDQTRMTIIQILTLHEMCVCDIAVALNMTHSSISHQLRVLKQARLVTYHKKGKSVYYRLDDHHVEALIEMGMAHIKEGHQDQNAKKDI